MKNKLGLSDIVITLIIIVLSLVAIGVVWVVVRNLITTGSQSISSTTQCLDTNIEITTANCSNGTTDVACDVSFTRTGTEQSAIGGIKLVFRNQASGISSNLISISGNIQPLVGERVSVNDTNVTNANGINTIEATPFFTDSSGKEQLCSQSTSFTLNQ